MYCLFVFCIRLFALLWDPVHDLHNPYCSRWKYTQLGKGSHILGVEAAGIHLGLLCAASPSRFKENINLSIEEEEKAIPLIYVPADEHFGH